MSFWRRKHKTSSFSTREELLSCVVSLYFYMSSSTKDQRDELAFIGPLLRSMFGSEIMLYEIEQARKSALSVREAANILSHKLDYADRLKLILNLISFAYYKKQIIRILSSLEIVELADLLRLDINMLDGVYDLFEGNSETVALPWQNPESNKGYIKNSMYWAPSAADLKTKTVQVHLVMVENLVLIRNLSAENLWIRSKNGNKALKNDIYYRILPDEALESDEFSLRFKELWQIYRRIDALESIADFMQEKELKKVHGLELQEYYLEHKQGFSISTEQSENSLLKFFRKDREWHIQPLQNADIRINMLTLQGQQKFRKNSDMLSILGHNFIVNRHWELLEIPLQVQKLQVQDVWHYFAHGEPALKGISFTLTKASMTAIMGPSGSGKTTLLQVLLGEIKAKSANIMLDSQDFLAKLDQFQSYLAYVPQDDLLFSHLTVYENLYYKLKLCLPELKDEAEISKRICNLLRSVDLYEQRNIMVGDVMNKKISGGQRRRLNIALELITEPAILILDEPTSGLSTRDSESIVQLLSELRDQGKIIISTIHQPNSAIFHSFDNVLLMDKGGVQVFFGPSSDAFNYFKEELDQIDNQTLNMKMKQELPELFFAIIDYRDIEDERVFDSEYWEKKYRDFSFIQALTPRNVTPEANQSQIQKPPQKNSVRKLGILIRRTFQNKIRNKLNLTMTLFASPILAFISSIVLRNATNSSGYSYYLNNNSLLFDFIAVLVFIFIGLANSIDDILSEKRIIRRELKIGISPICQLTSKHLVLLMMTIIQAILFYLVSALVLDMRGYFIPKVGFYTLAGISGYSLGLLFSSLIKDRSAVINILPLVIIPQIMFGGIVIEYTKMNPLLKLHKESDIPEFCHLIPSRWLVEGLVIGSARHSMLAHRQRVYVAKRKKLISHNAMTAELSNSLADEHEEFMKTHPQSRYNNQISTTLVNIAQGRYSSRQINAFLSYRIKLLGFELPTILVDIIASIMLIAVFAGLTIWRLKRLNR